MTPPYSAPSARREHDSIIARIDRLKRIASFAAHEPDCFERMCEGKDCDCGYFDALEGFEGSTARASAIEASDPAAMLEKVREALLKSEDALELDDSESAGGIARDLCTEALALLPPIRISGDASDTPAES